MDTQLVEKIVHEVKSQGVFDEFRKDSMADVDTKPAYQNLRQRVENTVKKFLAEQKWTPDTNKNQLREKLRRHITESGFLDVGVERIVDQVVNPKIGSVFQPRIEEIAYNYLGLPPPPKKYEQPPPPLMHPLPPLPLTAPPLKVETCSLLPTDLEQVSPDSDKATVKSEGDDKNSINMEIDDKNIDDEDVSPPFEPLVKQELENKDDIKMEMMKINENDTSSDGKKVMVEESSDVSVKAENLAADNNSQELSNFIPDTETSDKEASQSMDARISQESQLSSVSSDSRLSANDREDSVQSSSQEAVAANISEEAQMPKFNENSSEPSAINGNANSERDSKLSDLHFDIKKDEIKFEGTERKCVLKNQETSTPKTEDIKYPDEQANLSNVIKNESFKFSSNNTNIEIKDKEFEVTPNAHDSSFGSSIDDSSSVPAYTTPGTSLEIKEKDTAIEEKSPPRLTPKQQITITPTTTPLATPPMPTPTATPSPITSQKIDKDHSSRHSSCSSSKHKKHSKERRRSHDREKDKERHRSSKDNKDSNSKNYPGTSSNRSSKHSSSSTSHSKSSSSHNKSSNEKDLEKSSSSSTYSTSKHLKHSHSSSSSNEHNDSKKSKNRDSERRHHSSSRTNKEHSSTTTSSKRSEKKDDHNEAKNKSQRRKSTDSNDDDNDKSLGGGGKSSSQCKSNNSSSSASKSSKSKSSNDVNKSPSTKTNDSQKDNSNLQTDNEVILSKPFCNNNVIILNDILENPQTQFIQLDKTGHLVETPQQIVDFKSSDDNIDMTVQFDENKVIAPMTKTENILFNTGLALIYFEEIHTDYTERIKLLDNAMDLCRRAVNSLRFDSQTDEGIELSNEEDVNSDNSSNLPTQTTLKRKSEIDYEEYEKTPRKRVASNESEGCSSKTSPTPSYSSVNSKENEEFYKNTDVAKKSLIDRHKAVQKLTLQQRYSSEDLYKPRPVLGQRSRRRGMDSIV